MAYRFAETRGTDLFINMPSGNFLMLNVVDQEN
jgi:hypothetical protein